jgi:predicted short-subunit dehydrogenase-like oxidoreductase (DUF2520 family)
MHILIIGAGNVGTNLARLAAHRDLSVTLWNPEPTSTMTQELLGKCKNLVSVVNDTPEGVFDLALLAVPESDLAEAATRVIAWPGLSGTAIAHTSGSVGPFDADEVTVGVCHPAFAFPSPGLPIEDLAEMAVLIDGPEEVKGKCKEFLDECKIVAVEAPGRDALLYHTACVTAANFLSLLGAETENLFTAASVPAESQRPLIRSLMKSVLAQAVEQPFQATLTGPAARGDSGTVITEAIHLADHHPEFFSLFLEANLRIAALTDNQKLVETIENWLETE